MSSKDAQISELKIIFSDASDELLTAALAQAKDNMETAVDLLLNNQVKLPSKKKEEQQKELDDVELAKKLQQELNLEDETKFSEDFALAKKLMEEDDASYASSFTSTYQYQSSYQPQYQPQYQQDTSPEIDLSSLDANVVNTLLGSIKSSVVPFFEEELQGFEVPSIGDEVDAGSLGRIAFGVKDLTISEVKVPAEKIALTFENPNIKLEVKGIKASCNQFNWFYDKLSGIPKLKDKGKGTVTLTDMDLSLLISVEGADNIQVKSSEVKIGSLEIKTSGTVASVLYNFVIGLFKKKIKTTLEHALSEMLADGIRDRGGDLIKSIDM